jgi:hypothetical protein
VESPAATRELYWNGMASSRSSCISTKSATSNRRKTSGHCRTICASSASRRKLPVRTQTTFGGAPSTLSRSKKSASLVRMRSRARARSARVAGPNCAGQFLWHGARRRPTARQQAAASRCYLTRMSHGFKSGKCSKCASIVTSRTRCWTASAAIQKSARA